MTWAIDFSPTIRLMKEALLLKYFFRETKIVYKSKWSFCFISFARQKRPPICLYAILPFLYPGGTPLYSHIDMCYPKGEGFCAGLVWKQCKLCPFWSWIGYGLRFASNYMQMEKKFGSSCQKPNEKTRKNLPYKLSVIREVTTLFQLLICQISAAGCLGVKNSTACITGKESSYVKPFQQSSFRVVQWYSQRRVRCWRKASHPSFWQRGNSFVFKLPKSLFGRKAIIILNERVSKINIHSVNKWTKYKVNHWDHIINESLLEGAGSRLSSSFCQLWQCVLSCAMELYFTCAWMTKLHHLVQQICLLIIHWTHSLSSHWLRAYSLLWKSVQPTD